MTKQTWMITGTSSGFGKALATKLAQKDDIKLIATARKMDDLNYLDKYDHGQIKKILVDVSKPDQIKNAAKEAISFNNEIDVLINNAGLGYFSTIEESDMDEVRYMFNVNVFGLAEMTMALLPQFRKQKHGTIVNISSALALTTLPTMGFYSASKYAVEGFGDALRKEVESFGINVLNVEPSGARTNWTGSSSKKVVPKIADYNKYVEMVSTTDAGVTNSPGDPNLIADAIINAVNSPSVPHHLPLGEFAYNGGLANLKSLVKEIESNRDISLSTDNK